jgi:hypothetical protein
VSRARKFGSGSGANTEGKSSVNNVFFEKGRLKRIQTVLFSGLPFYAKNALSPSMVGQPGSIRSPIWTKIKGVPKAEKRRSFFDGKK